MDGNVLRFQYKYYVFSYPTIRLVFREHRIIAGIYQGLFFSAAERHTRDGRQHVIDVPAPPWSSLNSLFR